MSLLEFIVMMMKVQLLSMLGFVVAFVLSFVVYYNVKKRNRGGN